MRVMFVGDVSLGEHFFSFGHGPRTLIEKGHYVFDGVHEVLSKADYVVANLEGPISDIGFDPNDPLSRVFRGCPESIEQLERAGINILNLANNHTMQHGSECFDDTVNLIEKTGLKVAGITNVDGKGYRPVIVDNHGVRLALISCSTIIDNFLPDQNRYSYFDLEAVCAEVRSLISTCHVVIVMLHWGLEGDVSASDEQKKIAETIVASGAHVVVGHHPHVFFEIEQIAQSIVAYSLGDFVFDLPWDDKLMKSGILDIIFSDNGEFESIAVWPVSLDRCGSPHVSGNKIILKDWKQKYLLYKFNKPVGRQFDKLVLLMANMHRGGTLLKVKFLLWKLKKKLIK